MLPHGLSTVLANKRAERVSKKQAFAQLGLRAAIGVQWFRQLDANDSGYINVPDLVSVFGNVSGVTKEQAFQIAQTIVRTADNSKDGKITFNEFMNCLEGGDTLDFNRFVDLVYTTARKGQLDAASKLAASEAYDAVEAGIDLSTSTMRRSITAAPTASAPTDASPFDVTDTPAPATPAAPATLATLASPASPASAARETAAQTPHPTTPAAPMYPDAVLAHVGASPVAHAAAMPVAQPVAPKQVARLACLQCKQQFGVPPGATLVRCPHCQTTNGVPPQPHGASGVTAPALSGTLVPPPSQMAAVAQPRQRTAAYAAHGYPAAHGQDI